MAGCTAGWFVVFCFLFTSIVNRVPLKKKEDQAERKTNQIEKQRSISSTNDWVLTRKQPELLQYRQYCISSNNGGDAYWKEGAHKNY